MSSYSQKKPKNPLNKKYIEHLLDRNTRPPLTNNPYELAAQDDFTKKLIRNYDNFLPKQIKNKFDPY